MFSNPNQVVGLKYDSTTTVEDREETREVIKLEINPLETQTCRSWLVMRGE